MHLLSFSAGLAQFIGFALASYGVLREAFLQLAAQRPFGEGRFGEGPFGGGLTPLTDRLLRMAVAFRLMPFDRELTITDRKRNAALAVAGVLLYALGNLIDLVTRLTT